MNMKLGNILRDRVTGFEGTAVSRVEYLNGCVQYCLLPLKDKDGKFPEGVYVDWQRLDLVSEGEAPRKSNTGGPQRDAPGASFRG